MREMIQRVHVLEVNEDWAISHVYLKEEVTAHMHLP
jgi:hypothetical protein